MLEPGETVLVALSGGADSMCLLHLLCSLRETAGIQVQAAHLNHQIRAEGAADAEFVRQWCRSAGVACHVGERDVPRWAAERGMGLEEAGRKLRYDFLEECAARCGAAKIATAHNANDNAETLLLHLVRGTGLAGLGGIAPVRGKIIRPLLTASREEILAYLEENHVPHVEDASNLDCAYSRNYMRHQVLPLLREQNPRLLEGLSRTAALLRRDEDYLEEQAEAFLAGAVREEPDGVSVPAAALAALPEPVSSRAVQRLYARLLPEEILSSAHREGLLALCRSESPSGTTPLPGGIEGRRRYDRLALCRRAEEAAVSPRALAPGEEVLFGARRIRCDWAICPEGKFNRPERWYLRPGETLLLRPRRTGDCITLPGRPPKSVKKLLIDSKIPRQERDGLAVFELDGALAGLDGFGADAAFLPEAGERCWRITSEPV